MELSFTIASQVAVMFLLIIIGFISRKIGMTSDNGRKDMTNLLLYFVMPIVIINAYNVEYTPEIAVNLGYAFLLGVISHLIAIGASYLFVRKKGENGRRSIERFAVIYSNCGFMAIPLIQALFQSEGVFYASTYMLVFQVLSWTHGYIMMAGKTDKQTVKSAFLSPVIFSVIIGLIIFFGRISLPDIISTTFTHMAALNTPVAMLVTGITLAQTDILASFKQPRCYYITALSCLVVPLIAAVIYLFVPIDRTVIIANLISLSCPPAVLTLLFPAKFGLDEKYAAQLLTISNICCIFTIPIVVSIYQALSRLI